jgi:imidazolonepropionase-like amidohydrolase
VPIPSDARVINASGKFLVPGFVDTNVHLAPWHPVEHYVRYLDRSVDIAVETAQMLLRAGVTTVRDSYGPLRPLLAARDAISRGEVIGPRVYVAGNIVGWGGPRSATFETWGLSHYFRRPPGLMDGTTSYIVEVLQDEITHGTGEELILMEPRDLTLAIRAYLEKGSDFVKYGGTTHGITPSLITFSPRQQEAIVQEVHRQGKVVETHSTSPEGLRISLLAGVDLVQHPEQLDGVTMSDELVGLLRSNEVICSMNVQHWTGRAWSDFLRERGEHQKTRPNLERDLTGTERRLEWYWRHDSWRVNGIRLIEAGCRISTASDTLTLPPPDLTRGDEPYVYFHLVHAPGEGTLRSIEGLVEAGMSPMDALVSATKHGAMASHALDEYGTIEPGKSADMLLLKADPLDDIKNIRELSMVMARGQTVDTAALPTSPVHLQR